MENMKIMAASAAAGEQGTKQLQSKSPRQKERLSYKFMACFLLSAANLAAVFEATLSCEHCTMSAEGESGKGDHLFYPLW